MSRTALGLTAIAIAVGLWACDRAQTRVLCVGDAMQPIIACGDQVIIEQNPKPGQVQIGDIIVWCDWIVEPKVGRLPTGDDYSIPYEPIKPYDNSQKVSCGARSGYRIDSISRVVGKKEIDPPFYFTRDDASQSTGDPAPGWEEWVRSSSP